MMPGIAGEPIPKKPNLRNHAVMEMSMTTLIPYLLRKNGMSRMHRVSEI